MDFSKVKLKKVETKEKGTKIGLTQLCETSEDYQRMMQDAYLEKYYSSIASFTFPSVFVPMSKQVAQEIRNYHELWKKDKKDPQWQQSTILNELSTSITESLSKHPDWKGFFVRLSSRSPKDAPLTLASFTSVLQSELENVKKMEQEVNHFSTLQNQKLHALYRASTYSMKCNSPQDAIELLIRSARIQDDIQQFINGNITSEFNIVLREFRTFDPDLEFRGFVYKKKLTALTQYNEFCFFPPLLSRKDELMVQIREQFEKEICPILPLDNCVVDFLFCVPTESQYATRSDRYSDLRVWIVELNPLGEFASTGLFSWESEDDKRTILGQKEFEFRAHTKEPEGALHNIASEWRPFILQQ